MTKRERKYHNRKVKTVVSRMISYGLWEIDTTEWIKNPTIKKQILLQSKTNLYR